MNQGKFNNFTFDEATHTYRLDGSIIPGFSQVAQAMGIVYYPYENQRALDFGKAFHLATKFLDKETLDKDTLAESLIPLIEQYKQLKKDLSIEEIQEYIETPIYSKTYRYGTTPDRIALVKSELSIVEFKTTTTMSASVKLQTAAHKIAAEEFYGIKIKHRYGVQFSLTDKCKLFHYKDKADECAWLNCLGAYNWLKKEGMIK